MSPPLLTIGLPVFNGMDYLRSALDSLLAQELADFRLIVSDNSSTDETEAIGREYAARDARVQYDRSLRNVGSWGNFTRVYELGRGTKYFMWTSHHDLWAPSFARRCIERLEADPSIVVAYPLTQYIDLEGRPLDTPEPAVDTVGLPTVERLERVMNDYPICAMMGVHRRSALERTQSPHGIGLYRALSHPTPDAILLLRLAAQGGFAVIPERLYFNRQFRHVKWTDEGKIKQLAPERPDIHAHRLALTRDLIEMIFEAELTRTERARVARVLFAKWIWPYRKRLIYELDVFRIYSRLKRLLQIAPSSGHN